MDLSLSLGDVFVVYVDGYLWMTVGPTVNLTAILTVCTSRGEVDNLQTRLICSLAVPLWLAVRIGTGGG